MSDKSYIFGNCSHVGRVRTENQDYFGFFSTVFGELFVVCDGVGGNKGGSVASRTAVEAIRRYFDETELTDAVSVLGKSLQYADQEIFKLSDENPELYGMGTTCVAFLLQQGVEPKGWVAHAGDSRMYRIRRKHVEQLTKDHSRVQEMVDHGILTPEQAEEHQDSNIVTLVLGGTVPGVQPDVSPVEICKGDRYVIVTDGVSKPVGKPVILTLSRKNSAPQEFSEALVAMANDLDGGDNATVQVIDIKSGPRAPFAKPLSEQTEEKKKFPIPVWLASTLAGVLALAVVFLVVDPLGRGATEQEVEQFQHGVEHQQPFDEESLEKIYQITTDTDTALVALSIVGEVDTLTAVLTDGYESTELFLTADSKNDSLLCLPGRSYTLTLRSSGERSFFCTLQSTLLETIPSGMDTEHIALLEGSNSIHFSADTSEATRQLSVEEGATYVLQLDETSVDLVTLTINGILPDIDPEEGTYTWKADAAGSVPVLMTLLEPDELDLTVSMSVERAVPVAEENAEVAPVAQDLSEPDGVVYDENGLDPDGYDENGFTLAGIHRDTETLYDLEGFDVLGNDAFGFNRSGVHVTTGTERDPEGYDAEGFNESGFGRDGYNRRGFLIDETHRNGTNYDDDGYDIWGYNESGRNEAGYDHDGLDVNGFRRDGTYRNTGLPHDEEGYGRDGYHVNHGRNREGYDRGGYDEDGYDHDGYDINGFNADGFDRDGNPRPV